MKVLFAPDHTPDYLSPHGIATDGRGNENEIVPDDDEHLMGVLVNVSLIGMEGDNAL